MNIGIDAKVLAKRRTGIGVYVEQMVMYFSQLDTEDEFYLFTNQEFTLNFDLGKNFHQVVVHPKLRSLGIIFCLGKYLKKYKIDVFWGTEHIIPWTKVCKTVVTIHDLAVLMNPKLGTKRNAIIQKLFTIPSCRKADKIIAISNSTKNDVIKLCKVDDDKVQVIYNGDSPYNHGLSNITEEQESSIRNKFDLHEKYFLFVSTIEPRKNVPTIVKGFNLYKKKTGSKSKLVLAGGLGWRYKASLEAINESPYINDIIRTGYCSNIEKEFLYRNAKALLFPSLYEGFGFPILEAFSVGCPVITAYDSSLPEVGGDVAFYIKDPFDAEAMSSYLIKIDSLSEEERDNLSSLAKKRALLFSRKECAENILKELKS